MAEPATPAHRERRRRDAPRVPGGSLPAPGAPAAAALALQRRAGNAGIAAWRERDRPASGGRQLQRAILIHDPDVKAETHNALLAFQQVAHLAVSERLSTVMEFLAGSSRFDLDLVALAGDDRDHGNTGIFIGPPGDETPILEEAFFEDPLKALIAPKISIVVNVGEAGNLAQFITTLLHELELHVAPAGALCMALDAARSDEAAYKLVIERLAHPDEHRDLVRIESFVRAGARLGEEFARRGAPTLGEAIAQAVIDDAEMQLLPAETAAGDTLSEARALWFASLRKAVLSGGSRARPQLERPLSVEPDAPPPAPHDDDFREQLTAMLEAGVPFHQAIRSLPQVSTVEAVEFYERQLVLKLLDELRRRGCTSKHQATWHATRFGVPHLMALSAWEGGSQAERPRVRDLKLRPPEHPDFWLDDDEGDWTPETGVPRSVLEAAAKRSIKHGDLIFVDGRLCRVAVLDKPPPQEVRRARQIDGLTVALRAA